MRDYGSKYDLGDDSYAETGERPFGGARTIAMLGAVALIATPAIVKLARRWRTQRNRHRNTAVTEPAIDKSLQDTFPASDPPASRYFDIPANRL
jgi:hypothetical protein